MPPAAPELPHPRKPLTATAAPLQQTPAPSPFVQHAPIRELLSEGSPGDNRRRKQFKPGSSKLTDDSLTGDLLPPAFRLPVPHHQVAVPEVACGAKSKLTPVHYSVERDGRVAQRAERDGHGSAANSIVDNLVPHQDGQRVRSCVTLDLKRYDGFFRAHVSRCFRNRGELRLIHRSYAVTRQQVLDLSQRHSPSAEICLPSVTLEPAGQGCFLFVQL